MEAKTELDQLLDRLKDISKSSAASERALKSVLADTSQGYVTPSAQVQKWYDTHLETIKDIAGFEPGEALETFLAQNKIDPINAHGLFTLAQCGTHRNFISNVAHGEPVTFGGGYINTDQKKASAKIDTTPKYKNEKELVSILQQNEKNPGKYYYIGVSDAALGHDYSIIQKGGEVLLLQSYIGKYSLDNRLNGNESVSKEKCHSLDDFIDFLSEPNPSKALQIEYYGAADELKAAPSRFKIPPEGCHEIPDIALFVKALHDQQLKFEDAQKRVEELQGTVLSEQVQVEKGLNM